MPKLTRLENHKLQLAIKTFAGDKIPFRSITEAAAYFSNVLGLNVTPGNVRGQLEFLNEAEGFDPRLVWSGWNTRRESLAKQKTVELKADVVEIPTDLEVRLLGLEARINAVNATLKLLVDHSVDLSSRSEKAELDFDRALARMEKKIDKLVSWVGETAEPEAKAAETKSIEIPTDSFELAS